MQREIVKWLQGLSLSSPIRNPRRDMANGVAAAEVVAHYCGGRGLERDVPQRQRDTREDATEEDDNGDDGDGRPARIALNTRAIDFSATSADAKRGNWNEVLRVLHLLRCKSVTSELVEAVVHLHPNAAQAVLENMYEFFTHRKLGKRSADPLVAADGVVTAVAQADGAGRQAKAATGVGLGAVAQGNYLHSQEDVQSAATLLASTGEVTAPRALGNTAGLSKTSASALPTGYTLAYFIAANQQPSAKAMSRTAPAARGSKRRAGAFEGVADRDAEALQEMQDTLLPAAATEVQSVLALTRNEALAAGPRGLQLHARAPYMRPTASTLVHAASSSRHEVSLAKPKFTDDERTAQERNERIVAQHEALKKMYYRAQEPRAAATPGAPPQGAAASRESSHPSGRKSAATAKDSPEDGAHEPTLTAILRGPFAANTATRPRHGAAAVRDRKGRRQQRGGPSVRTDRSGEKGMSPPSSPYPSHARLSTATGGGTYGSIVGGGNGPRHIHVNTVPDSLRAALEVNGVYLKADERAEEKSLQLFQECHWRLPAALSHALKDLLQARRELNTLLEMSRKTSAVHRSDEVVLQDLLSCIAAHRASLSADTRSACWDALRQHTAGIAASILHRPGEYEYLLQTFGYAFHARAARVRLLHVSASSETSCGRADEFTVVDGNGGNEASDVPPHLGRRQSIGEALLAAATRHPSVAAALLPPSPISGTRQWEDGHPLPPQMLRPPTPLPQPQRALLKDDEALSVGRVFMFLRDVGRAIIEQRCRPPVPQDAGTDVSGVALRVMEKFFLPAVTRFVLSTGTPAVVEAAACVMVATLYPATISTAGGGRLSAETCANELVRFLEVTVREQMELQVTGFAEDGSSESRRRCEGRFALVAYHVLSQALQQQRSLQGALLDAPPSREEGVEEEQQGQREAVERAAATLHQVALAFATRYLDAAGEDAAALRTFGVGFLRLVAPTIPLPSPSGGEAGEGSAPLMMMKMVVRVMEEARKTGSESDKTPWERRALTLELLLSVADRLLPSEDAVGERQSVVEDLEDAALACMRSFARDFGELEQQLALGIVSRRVMPDVYPRLAETWLSMLLALSPDAFQRSLLPYETEPLSLDVCVGSDAPTAEKEAFAAPSLASRGGSSIRLLFGSVEASYVVAPLNQHWNTSGVVHLVLRNLASMSRASVLAVVAAALLSPQPVSAQEEEIAVNVRMPLRAEARGESAEAAENDGKDSEHFAFTLRDVVGDFQDDLHDDGGGDSSAPDAAYTASFWRGALRLLAPTLRSSLSSLPAEGDLAGVDAEGGAVVVDSEEAVSERETAIAVLLTMFRTCASAADVQLAHARRAQGLDVVQTLLSWAADCQAA